MFPAEKEITLANKFQGIKCPICGEPFGEKDDVVVCPECGAPYHRDCIAKAGGCVFKEQHGPDFTWQPPNEQAEKEAKYDGQAPLRCSRCGTLNPYGGLFCEVCGTPLTGNQEEQPFPGQNPGQQSQGGPQGYGPFGPGFHSIPYNPYTTPFGGLGADEEIDGVPVKDLALFVGENPHYFLPKFKDMKNRRGLVWNWAALFFQFFYFFYRKMWGMAAVSLILNLLLEIPTVICYIQIFLYQAVSQPLYMLTMACWFLSLGVRIFFGVFANKIYMYTVFRRVKKIRTKYSDESKRNEMYLKKGSVSKVGTIVIGSIYAVLMLVSYFMTIWMGI